MDHIFHLLTFILSLFILESRRETDFCVPICIFSLQGRLGFGKKHTPSSKKFIDGGGKVSWSVTSKDTGITLKSDG